MGIRVHCYIGSDLVISPEMAAAPRIGDEIHRQLLNSTDKTRVFRVRNVIWTKPDEAVLYIESLTRHEDALNNPYSALSSREDAQRYRWMIRTPHSLHEKEYSGQQEGGQEAWQASSEGRISPVTSAPEHAIDRLREWAAESVTALEKDD